MEPIIDILAVLLIFGSPVIITRMVLGYRLKKAQLASAPGAGARAVDDARIVRLEAEAREMQKRIATLESIVVDNDAAMTARAAGLQGARDIEALAKASAPVVAEQRR